eukprot:CAMPEP_0184109520 /NCGR_PEP_ID=MMETSP0974-20121125/16932_1 /TAXON_ID=483370 /ORGANISM="non described non described, Strain CCMP2097" /LENGTH=81 /DNA_ID=CAMNT_0026412565 /DNA_START=24 /DNA_END=266 /DNA_ORIENTATION=+
MAAPLPPERCAVGAFRAGAASESFTAIFRPRAVAPCARVTSAVSMVTSPLSTPLSTSTLVASQNGSSARRSDVSLGRLRTT